MLLNKTLVGKNEKKVPGKKIEKDRITALCANANRSYKLPLLLISKYGKPRALKHCKNNLPDI